MTAQEPLIRNISDTALWAAVYRARENERPGGLFQDPFARRLAGDRGEQIARSIPPSEQHNFAWITRTVLFDRYIEEQLRDGVDLVLNLAAGLDARPYRMPLRPELRWVEVDLPGIIDYKTAILAGETPRCRLERIKLDLAEPAGRADALARATAGATKALVITEGLIVYLDRDQVAALARDLAAVPALRRWVFDLVSPGLLRILQKKLGPHLEGGRAPLKFGPPEGPDFFVPHGWQTLDVRSMIKTAASLKLLPFWLRLVAKLPASNGAQGSRPWSGICLIGRP